MSVGLLINVAFTATRWIVHDRCGLDRHKAAVGEDQLIYRESDLSCYGKEDRGSINLPSVIDFSESVLYTTIRARGLLGHLARKNNGKLPHWYLKTAQRDLGECYRT